MRRKEGSVDSLFLKRGTIDPLNIYIMYRYYTFTKPFSRAAAIRLILEDELKINPQKVISSWKERQENYLAFKNESVSETSGYSVIIVGPSTYEEREIFNYDYIALTNPSRDHELVQAQETESIPPLIAFFNIEGFERNLRDNPTHANTFDHTFVKSKSQLKALKANGVTSVHLIDEASNYYITDFSSHAILNAICSLIRFGFSCPTVSGANLFTSSNPVRSSRDPYPVYSSRWLGMRCHDVIAEFQFLKMAFTDGLFKGDSQLMEILSLSLEDYAKLLDTVHGNEK